MAQAELEAFQKKNLLQKNPKMRRRGSKRVFLLSPPFLKSQYNSFRLGESLGIRYIASYLELYGHEVDVLEPSLMHLSIKSTVELILKNDYDLIGFAVPNGGIFPNVVKAIKLLRDNSFRGHITVGGHFPTFEHIDILTHNKNIDSVVRFEGEVTTLELLENLGIETYGNILGLSFRLAKQVRVNSPRPFIKNLDELPFPKRNKYKEFGNHFTMITSRGCYGNCSFCSVRAFYSCDKQLFRQRSADNIVDEIEDLTSKYDAKVISFMDDNFIGPGISGKRMALEIAKKIKNKGLEILFEISCRPDCIDKDILNPLKNIGLRHVSLGIESGVDRILEERFNKKTTVSENINAMKILKGAGLSFLPYFIMFDPFVNIKDLRDNLEFLYRNKICTYNAVKSTVTLYKGTPMHDKLKNSLKRVKWVYYYDFSEGKIHDIFQVIISLTNLDKLDHIVNNLNYKIDTSDSLAEKKLISDAKRIISTASNEFIYKTMIKIIDASVDDKTEKNSFVRKLKCEVLFFEKSIFDILADRNLSFICE